MSARIDPIAIAQSVARTLDALGVPNTIGGSIASSLAGEPRSTIDIDFVVALADAHVGAFVAAVASDFYVDDEALRRAIRTRTSANLIHRETSLKVDLFVAGGTALDDQQLARRLAVTLGDGMTIHVHPPEDILLQKLRWYHLGREASDRQWRDVLAIVRVQGARLDREYLRQNAPVLDVSEVLERALDEGAG